MRFQLDGRHVDLERCQVHGPEGTASLTPQEAQILRFLADHRGRAVTRTELLQEVWGYANAAPTRAVDNAIYRLRTKIEADPTQPIWLQTARGVGYRFEPPPPPDVSGLHGRERDLQRLREALAEHGHATLVGPAGIGKTALASAWAAQSGASTVPLSGVQPGGLASVLSDTLEVPLAPRCTGPVAIDRIGRALLGRRLRHVVLDNAEELRAEVAEVASIWAGLGVAFVITSQDPIEHRGEVLVTLGPVSREAARAIYLGHAPAHGQLERMLEQLDGIPLAILLAAARAEQLGPSQVVRLLDDPDARATQGTLPALSAALEAGLARLPEPESTVLDAVTLFPRGAPLDALVSCTELAAHEIVAGLDGLRARALLRRPGVCTFPIVRLLRDGQLDPGLLQRWGRWLLDNPHRADVHRAARRLEEAAPELAARLWERLNRPMLLQGPVVPEWADAGVRCATRAADPTLVAESHLLRGAIRTLCGDLTGALDDLALAEAGPEPVAMEATVRRGWSSLFAGRPHEALQILGDARDRARRLGLGRIEAMAEVRLASVQHRLGRADLACTHLQRAYGLYEGLDNLVEAARCRSNLAMMHVELGQTDRARSHLQTAMDLDRAQGVHAALPQHLLNLGGVEIDAGNPALAQEHLQAAVTEALAFGDEETHALCLLSLGVTAALLGDGGTATQHLSRARLQLQRNDNPMVVGIAWVYLAIASSEPAESDAALEEAAAAFAAIEAPVLGQLLGLARAARALPDPEPARTALAESEGAPQSFVRVARKLLLARLEEHPTTEARRAWREH